MVDSFVKKIDTQSSVNPIENVYGSIFKEYKKVVVDSLITSFGLDLLIQNRMDQYGGDVDTVHNVRKIGMDPNMKYKSAKNEAAYKARGEYNKGDYHSHNNFTQKKSQERHKWQETGHDIQDAYTNKGIGFHGHTHAISPDKKAELDHIVECKAIHEDRGRVLSGLSGVDLGNSDDNLAFTNKSLNASMGSWARQKNEAYKKEHGCDAPMELVDMRAYVNEHPDLEPETKKNMLEYYDKAKKSYDHKINRTYYTSRSFFNDSAKAAAKMGLAMGARQALGLVFSEIWFAVEDEFKNAKQNGESLFKGIGNGIKKGLENAKSKYKKLWSRFIEGSLSGVLSSITTTLCNIFFTTSKRVVHIVRQTWASMVEAVKILLFNPDCLPFGERFRAAAKIIATGASVVVGSLVGDLINKTGVGAIPVLGGIIQNFCTLLVTGIMSCSLLYLLDHNSAINKIVNVLNQIPTVDDIVIYYQRQGELLEAYCAKLQDLDIETFKKEVNTIIHAVDILDDVKNEQDLTVALKSICLRLNIPSPYGDCADINTFMEDKSNVLRFC